MFQSRNVEVSKSSSRSCRYLTHTTDKGNDRTRRQVWIQNCFVVEYDTDGSTNL